MTWWRASLEAFIVAVTLVGLMWLFGLRPEKDSLGTDDFLWPMLAFSLLVFTVL